MTTLASKTSKNLTKLFNNNVLCDQSIRSLYDHHRSLEDDNIHFVYKIVDRINDYVYYGKYSARCFAAFKKYAGSGTLLRYMIAEHGIQNFEQHIVGFYETAEEASQKEAELVNKAFIRCAKTYNLMLGGKTDFSNEKSFFHCTRTDRTFCCHTLALPRILKEFPQMKPGYSPTHIENSVFVKSSLPKIVADRKFVKMEKINLDGEYTQIKVAVDDVINHLHQGWQVCSTKLWVHIPGEAEYKRGINWKQIASSTENVLGYITKGYVVGRPPKLDGAKVNYSYKFRQQNKTA